MKPTALLTFFFVVVAIESCSGEDVAAIPSAMIRGQDEVEFGVAQTTKAYNKIWLDLSLPESADDRLQRYGNGAFPTRYYKFIYGDDRDKRTTLSCLEKKPDGTVVVTSRCIAGGDNNPDKLVHQTFYSHGFFLTQSRPPEVTWLRISLPAIQHHDIPLQRFKTLGPKQRINRFPLIATEINKKDSLARNILHFKKLFGEEFDFHPETYFLPDDIDQIKAQAAQSHNTIHWIAKPTYGGQGLGIKLVTDPNDIPIQDDYVVQKYIMDPMLINGHKFTMRLYTLITSIHPLKIFIHRNGVIKFATGEYTTTADGFQDDDFNRHITNQARNKDSPDFVVSEDPTVDNVGSRWSIRGFLEYIRKQGQDDVALWKRVQDTVTKTVFAVYPHVSNATIHYAPSRKCCFQLLGVDVDITSSGKVYFIEGNVNPTLGGSRAVFDNINKEHLMNETFDLLGLVNWNVSQEYADIKQQIKKAAENSTFHAEQWSDEDFDIFSEYEYERHHLGEWDMVFPTKESLDTHSKYFLSSVHENQVLADYIRNVEYSRV